MGSNSPLRRVRKLNSSQWPGIDGVGLFKFTEFDGQIILGKKINSFHVIKLDTMRRVGTLRYGEYGCWSILSDEELMEWIFSDSQNSMAKLLTVTKNDSFHDINLHVLRRVRILRYGEYGYWFIRSDDELVELFLSYSQNLMANLFTVKTINPFHEMNLHYA